MEVFKLNKKVLFVDHGKWCGEPHDWIREFFRNWGYEILESPSPPWMQFGVSYRDMPSGACATIDCYDLSQMMRATVMRQIGAYGVQGSVPEVTKDLAPVVVRYWEVLRQYVLIQRPQYVVVFGDYRVEAQLLWSLCCDLGIRVFALEGCFLSDRYMLEEVTGRCGNRTSFQSHWYRWKDIPLSESQKKTLLEYVKSDRVGISRDGKIKQPPPLSVAEVQKTLGIPQNAKLAVVLGQVWYDSVIAEDTLAFERSVDCYSAAIDAFAGLPSCYVVVRCHPKEAKEAMGDVTANALRNRRYLHDRFRIVAGEELNTYSLMDAADFGITVNSQAGLELLLRGKPLVVCGRSFYSGQGFTIDVSRAFQLGNTIEHVAQDENGFAQMNEALSFAYHYIYHYLVPRTRKATFDRLAVACTLPAVQRRISDYAYHAWRWGHQAVSGLVKSPWAKKVNSGESK